MFKFPIQPHGLKHEINAKHSIWAISWVCFFWSIASEMIFSVWPIFLKEELHVSMLHIGFINGFAVFLSFLARVCAGILSDYWHKRKTIIMFGTFLNMIIKPLFAIASSFSWALIALTLDRIVKGIRAAPTYALIADFSPTKKEGTNYGLRQSLYSLGTVIGCLLATVFMWWLYDYRLLFWLAIIPAIIALLVLKFFVKESDSIKCIYKKHSWKIVDIKKMPKMFWHLLGITFILMLARFSVGFLALHAKHLGWQIASIPLVTVAYEIAATITAMPAGQLADQVNRNKLLCFGISILLIADLLIVGISHWGSILIGAVLGGIHFGITQGLIYAMIAEFTIPTLRGTAFALYFLTISLATLVANLVAGHLSHTFGTIGAFYGGAIFTLMAAIYSFVIARPIVRSI